MKRSRNLVAGLVLAFLTAACTGPAQAYMEADRDTYAIVAPKLTRYVENDAALTAPEKQRTLDLIASWRVRWSKAMGVK